MKKVFIVVLGSMILAGCTKEHDILPNIQQVTPELAIASSVGIKLQSAFVTSEVAMNVKSQVAGTATIKILDISNKVVSKETIDLKVGDNVLKVYTSALPSSAYRIGFYDVSGKEMGITDFNKIN
jgi:uncharacterized protein YcfL